MGVWVILHLPHLKKPDKRACGYPTLVIRGNVAKLRQIFFFLNVLRGERKRKRREGLLCVPLQRPQLAWQILPEPSGAASYRSVYTQCCSREKKMS